MKTWEPPHMTSCLNCLSLVVFITKQQLFHYILVNTLQFMELIMKTGHGLQKTIWGLGDFVVVDFSTSLKLRAYAANVVIPSVVEKGMTTEWAAGSVTCFTV